jgi:AI-2 transport protein TqsA
LNEQRGRLLYFIVGAASVFIILWGIRSLANVLNPILLALVITITVLPMPAWFQKKKLPGWVAIGLTILVVLIILVMVIGTVVLSISRLSTSIPQYIAQANNNQSVQTATTTLPPEVTSLLNQIGSFVSPKMVSDFVIWLVGFLGPFVMQLGWTLLIFVFMLSAALTLPKQSRQIFSPDNSILKRVTSFTADVQHYVSVMTLINFLVGLGDALLLWILGVEYALLWGILAWFMGYIPSVGFILALIPPLILAWVTGGPATAIIVLIGYILINGSVQNFIQPKMMGDRLNISPLVVFLSLFVWAFILGGFGALLAVPLTLIIFAILDAFPSTEWLVALARAVPSDQDKEKRKAAAGRFSGVWGKFRDQIIPERNME